MTIPDKKNPKNPIVIVEPDQGNRTYFLVPLENMKTLFYDIQKYIVLDNSSNTWTLHAEISIIPIGTSSTSIAERIDASKTLEDEVESVNEKFGQERTLL